MSQSPYGKGYFGLFKNGALTAGQGGVQGDVFASQRHGPGYSAAYAAAAMVGCNSAGVTLSAALATTYVGLVLSNPAGSGVNLAIGRVQGLLNVAPANETSFGLITGYAAGGITAHTTALTPINAFINGAAPVAKLDSAATLVGTPAWAAWFNDTPTATGVTSWNTDFQGGVLLPPGAYAAIGATQAGPASGFFGSIFWEEIPV